MHMGGQSDFNRCLVWMRSAKNEDKFEFECTVVRHESEGDKCITELFLKGSCENQVMFKNQYFICVMFKY
jgi:hypothetical protein